MVEPQELSARDVLNWAALESRAAEPNAFLSPHFVLPALRHLDPALKPTIFLTERVFAGQRELLSVAVLKRTTGTRGFPLSHWISYESKHSYLSGILVCNEQTDEVLDTLMDHLSRKAPHNGLELPRVCADGALGRSFARPSRDGYPAEIDVKDRRAVLFPATAGAEMVRQVFGKRMKDLDRRMRRLQERGDLSWRCHRTADLSEAIVEDFLALEHSGWKGAEGTSLRSRTAEEAFFREMVSNFAKEERAVFTELVLGEQAIASACHFLSGGAGFCFKIGWNPEYKAYSPGILNEVEFIRNAPKVFADVSFFDSGASEGSFINDMWPARRSLGTITIPTAQFAKWVARTTTSARSLKRNWHTSPLHPLSWHVSKPEWVTVAAENLSMIPLPL